MLNLQKDKLFIIKVIVISKLILKYIIVIIIKFLFLKQKKNSINRGGSCEFLYIAERVSN